MNSEAVKTEIQNVITANTERIGYKAARKQYAAGKTQIATLTALGIIDLMPAKFGFSDADAVIAAAQDNGKTVNDSFDSATKLDASELYTLLNEVDANEETTDEIDYNGHTIIVIGSHARGYKFEVLLADGRESEQFGYYGTKELAELEGRTQVENMIEYD